MTLGGIVLGLGLEYANAYCIGKSPSDANGAVSNTLAWSGVVLAISPLVAFVGVVWMPVVYPTREPQLILGLCLSVGTALSFLTQALQAVLVGYEDVRGIAKANLLLGLLWLVVATLAVQVSYAAVLTSWVGIQLVVVAYYLRRLGWGRRDWGIDTDLGVRQVRYGGQVLPGSIFRAINMRAGLYGLSVSASPVVVGVYVTVLAIAESLLYLPNALGKVVLGASARHGDRAPSLTPAYLAVALAGSAATVGAFFAGEWMLHALFGPEYVSGARALTILSLAMTVHAIGLLRLHYLLGRGSPAAASKAQFVTLVAVVVGVVLLAPRFGADGAAAATALAYAIFSLYLFAWRLDEVAPVGRAVGERE